MTRTELNPSTKFWLKPEISPRNRALLWQAYWRGIFETSELSSAKKAFDATARSYQLPGAILSEYSITATVIRRELQQLHVDSEALLVIALFRSGLGKGVVEGSNLLMQPDRITLFDFQQSLHAKFEDANYVSLTVPHSAIGYDPYRHPRLFHVETTTPIGDMLRNNLEWLLEVAPTASLAEAKVLSDGVTSLIRGLITRNLKDETIRTRFAKSREIAVRRYIKSHLQNPLLQPEHICRDLGISRAVLYRMFEEDGGVVKAKQALRLDWAMDQLCMSQKLPGAVGDIAKNWTFQDPAHFSRLFRDRFGLRPTDVIASGIRSPDPSEDGVSNLLISDSLNPLRSLYSKITKT